MAKVVSRADVKIKELVKLIRAKYGPHSIMFASEAKFIQVHRQSSGIDALDFALGGGYIYGRYAHIYGGEGTGKTFMAMLAAATVQREHPGAVVVWVDLEHVFDRGRARQVGIDLSRLILINEESIEHNLMIAEELIYDHEVKLFVFDSVAAMVTDGELEGSVMEQTMGVNPRLINRFLKRWTAKNAPKENVSPSSFVILLNQVREKIGGFSKIPPKPQPTGGRGLRFFTSLGIEVTKGEMIKTSQADDDSVETIFGHEIKALVVKNNTFPPQRVAKFLLCTRTITVRGKDSKKGPGAEYTLTANSVDNPRDLVRFAKYHDVITGDGAWLTYKGHKWNGKISAQAALKADKALAAELKKETMRAIEEKLGVYQETNQEKPEAGEGRRQKGAGKGKPRKR